MSCYSNDIWYRSPLFWEIFFIDRLSKMFVGGGYLGNAPVKIFPFLSLQLHYNYGISWGLFQKLPFGHMLIPVAIAVILFFLARYTFERQKQCYSVTGETLLIAGGFSNFVDRLSFGPVTDFIHLHYGSYSFPIFNIADIAISFGAIIMLYNFLLGDNE
ncbi:signal peptidase II [Candidatus Babeliales bacterium]|nr:signal peptidase II [Candidatus Babeliales bacterium]